MMKDPEKVSPRKSDEQEAPEQERMVTPQEAAGEDLAEMDEPPQAEGPRERVDEDMERKDRGRNRQ